MMLLPSTGRILPRLFLFQKSLIAGWKRRGAARLSLLPHRGGTVSALRHCGRLPGPVTAVAPVVIAVILPVSRGKQNPAAQPLSIHSQKAAR